ncbi:UvrABC system protein C [Melia azedarach]|uniref:UvrABC system protein C n=1 Tax=Melia azedarach TaxID=155640 RepID=A0ACC1XKF5_MELAZ|nr:UvrABC system protein C [Melia azedarach]
MGNCSFKGIADCSPNFVRVLTDSGSVLEFRSPKLAGEILQNYPGYGIFLRGHASSPLAEHERLISGQFYYLLPLKKENTLCESMVRKQAQHVKVAEKLDVEWMEHQVESPKMSSADFVENLETGSDLEVLPSQRNGVWKVKLVINTKQLEDILSEQVNTEALIEKMRMAATSASLTPRRSKNSWALSWKPAFFSVFKVPIIDNGKQKHGSLSANCSGS